MGDETHDAWVSVFAAIVRPPADPRRAACPNCGRFSVRFAYVADRRSRIGLCALWCDYCGHGHTLSRVRVPDGTDFIPLDAPEEVLRNAIPAFYDAAAHEARGPSLTEAADRPRAGDHQPLTEIRESAEHSQHLLSPREQEVVRLLFDGHTVSEIAGGLHISPATVRSHLQRVYLKLGRALDRRTLDS